MGSIKFGAAGLSAFAGNCEGQAAVVGSVSARTVSGGAFQPSAIAVDAAHADVVAAGAQFKARSQSTAATVTAAAQGFASTEADNAADIAAVGAAGSSCVGTTAG